MAFWMAASIGMNILGNSMQAEAQNKIANANYKLDLANQELQNALSLSQSEKAYNQALKVTNSQLTQLQAANDAQIEANTRNTLAAHYRAGLIQLQQGLAKKQQAHDRQLMRRTAGQALGMVNANAAASGTIGASVEAVAQDVERTLGEALVQADEQWDIQAQNYSVQMHDNYTNLLNMLKSGAPESFILDPERGTAIMQNAVQRPNLPSTGDIIVGGLFQGITQYAMSKASLGLGSSGSAPIDDRSIRR